MNKKGFTLIEVVGVLLILSLIFILVFPNMMNRFNKSRKAIDDLEKVNIEIALNAYVNDNRYILENGNKCIDVNELQEGKYIDQQMMNVLEENEIKSFDITISNSKLKEFNLRKTNCGVVNQSSSFILNGNDTEIVELGSTYQEKGFMLKNLESGKQTTINISYYNENNVLVGSDTKTTTSSTQNFTSINSSGVTTNTLTNYLVKYYAVQKDSKGKVIFEETLYRKIRVLDTTAPIITIKNSNVTIASNATSYNLNNLFTITDASSVTTKIETNLTLGVSGKYRVTITATDQSGNVSKETTTVTVQ